MKSTLDCLPCNLALIVRLLSGTTCSAEQKRTVIAATLDDLRRMDLAETPADNMSRILLHATDLIGDLDPYASAREQANALALSLMPSLRFILEKAEDRLQAAIRIALAGNAMDLAPQVQYDLYTSIDLALRAPLPVGDYDRLRSRLKPGAKVVVLGDNGGEVVLDRLLLEELRAYVTHLTYVVRGGPILNDATEADARLAGLDEVAQIVSTDGAWLGVKARGADRLLARLRAADLVIAKGMANYETLTEYDLGTATVAYLLRAKCQTIASALGVRLGEMVLHVDG